jgi:hypothetical protein
VGAPAARRDDAWPGTRWTLLLRAARGEPGSDAAHRAWEELIVVYRAPIEALVRRRLGRADAFTIDTTAREFFGYLFAYNFLKPARAPSTDVPLLERPHRGERRFRAWIQTTFKYWWLGRRREGADPNAARLGDRDDRITSLRDDDDEPDAAAAWDRSDAGDSGDETHWALGALDAGLRALRIADPQAAELVVRVHGLDGKRAATQAALAKEAGVSEPTMSRRVARATARLRECVHQEMADLAGASPADAGSDEEVRALETALRRERPALFSVTA